MRSTSIKMILIPLLLVFLTNSQASATSHDRFFTRLRTLSQYLSRSVEEPNGRLLLGRQTSTDNLTACLTPCSYITSAESCADDDLACDCGFITTAGVSGIAACADCFYAGGDTTFADEAVELGIYCGLDPVASITFAYTAVSLTTSGVTGLATSSSAPTHETITVLATTSSSSSVPVTTSTATVVPTPVATAAAASNTPSSSSGSGGLSGGAIGGIVGGIVGGFLILAALLFWYIRRKLSRSPAITEPPMAYEEQPQPKAEAPTVIKDVDMPSGRIQYPEGEADVSGRLSRAY